MDHRRTLHRLPTVVLLMVLLAGSGLGVVAAPPVASPQATPVANGERSWWDDAVCYEVFVRSFADSDGDGMGDLIGLIDQLDYINDGDPATTDDLGATCVWLMPIFDSTSYHGYDVEDYYTVDPDYGTNDDFLRLVEEAHARGIRIVLDLILNHTSVEHPWFQEALREPASPYRDWYIFEAEDPGYPGPWGAQAWHQSPVADEYYYGIFWSGMPDLNYRNPAVTEEARRISAFWLEEMGADGFRLDAIKHLIENERLQENTPETLAWLEDYGAYLREIAPDALTVGEIFGSTSAVLAPYYPNGLESFFHFDIGQQAINAANFGNGTMLVSAVAETMATLPDQRWAPFLTNHDQTRTMTVLNGSVGKAKVAATALLTLPGLPFIYYGEEIGMSGTKPDERLRTPMQWSEAPGGGFTEGQPWEPFQDDWQEITVESQATDPDSLLNHYRALIQLHTAHPALSHGDFQPFDTGEVGVMAFLRQSEAETVLVVINVGREPVRDALTIAASGLAPGTYALSPLLGDEPAAPLTVDDSGAIDGYEPLPELAAQTGHIFLIEPAA